MTEAGTIGAIVALLGAILAAFAGGMWTRGRLRRKQRPPHVPPVEPAKPPEKTAHEHDNDTTTDTATAITEAAYAHGVDPAVVADDLDWLRSDDV